MLFALLTIVPTGTHTNRPAAGGSSSSPTADGSVSAGSSQAAQRSGSSTTGIRSWIRSSPGSASVVTTANVVSQASGSSGSTDGSFQNS